MTPMLLPAPPLLRNGLAMLAFPRKGGTSVSKSPFSTAELDLRPLYYFLQVAELGSFSRAAAALSVSQPILSRLVRRLEEQLKVQLLHRTGRGVEVTEVGQRLLEHGRQIFAQVNAAQEDVAALRGAAAGPVAIGLPPLLSRSTTELVRVLRAHHPAIALTLREGYAADTLDWLAAGAIDIALLYNPPQIATLLTEPVLDDRLHVVGAPGQLGLLQGTSLPAAMLGNLALVLPPQPHRLRALADGAAHAVGTSLRIEAEVTGTLTLLELVRAGVGYTILPSLLVQADVSEGRLQSWPLVEPEVSPRLCIATSMQRRQTQASRAVLAALHEVLRRLRAS
jgi:LysR family nitrogen assimilation transcriptional regulator